MSHKSYADTDSPIEHTCILTASPNRRCRHRWADCGQNSGWRRSTTPRLEDYLYNKRVALWLDLVPALLNSTRPETPSTWYMPWQQSGWNYNNQYSSNYNNYQAPNATDKTFFVKGRINFFKFP